MERPEGVVLAGGLSSADRSGGGEGLAVVPADLLSGGTTLHSPSGI